MKETKLEIRFFTITEYEKEQEYLRERHQSGWKFVGYTVPCFYHFVKCEPEDVVYQLDYNKDGAAHKDEYVQMFTDCGWEYLMDVLGYSYFRKPVSEMKEDEEIFCDDSSRLDMIGRVFKGRMIPLIGIFLCCIVPQMFRVFHLQDAADRGIFFVFCALLVLYLILFVQFGVQYWRLKKRTER
ncbi:DUF2812 domain-containing protein [Hespellia stercorisuis]|uniref:DUF2812 domain-containing protein n=1 Tax=Hespellia stercorisuis DSM 15480 TaxID=1121950 RepID=A0A1M6MMV8_9FIRM|nr:DUF2812 domain-containing protein [Hespellia stercorisuis]SHJ84825.1 Protein of unknown function [Hespellia stercorisuis DSM 15480]